MARQTVLSIVVAEIEAAGYKPRVTYTKRHIKIHFKIGSQELLYVCPSTHSDHRSLMNNRACVRRLIRQAEQSDLSSGHD